MTADAAPTLAAPLEAGATMVAPLDAHDGPRTYAYARAVVRVLPDALPAGVAARALTTALAGVALEADDPAAVAAAYAADLLALVARHASAEGRP